MCIGSFGTRMTPAAKLKGRRCILLHEWLYACGVGVVLLKCIMHLHLNELEKIERGDHLLLPIHSLGVFGELALAYLG